MVGADAAPAASPRKRRLGRLRDPPGRHYDRSAGSRLDWDWLTRITPADASSQEARTLGLVSAAKAVRCKTAMERRWAGTPRQECLTPFISLIAVARQPNTRARKSIYGSVSLLSLRNVFFELSTVGVRFAHGWPGRLRRSWLVELH